MTTFSSDACAYSLGIAAGAFLAGMILTAIFFVIRFYLLRDDEGTGPESGLASEDGRSEGNLPRPDRSGSLSQASVLPIFANDFDTAQGESFEQGRARHLEKMVGRSGELFRLLDGNRTSSVSMEDGDQELVALQPSHDTTNGNMPDAVREALNKGFESALDNSTLPTTEEQRSTDSTAQAAASHAFLLGKEAQLVHDLRAEMDDIVAMTVLLDHHSSQGSSSSVSSGRSNRSARTRRKDLRHRAGSADPEKECAMLRARLLGAIDNGVARVDELFDSELPTEPRLLAAFCAGRLDQRLRLTALRTLAQLDGMDEEKRAAAVELLFDRRSPSGSDALQDVLPSGVAMTTIQELVGLSELASKCREFMHTADDNDQLPGSPTADESSIADLRASYMTGRDCARRTFEQLSSAPVEALSSTASVNEQEQVVASWKRGVTSQLAERELRDMTLVLEETNDQAQHAARSAFDAGKAKQESANVDDEELPTAESVSTGTTQSAKRQQRIAFTFAREASRRARDDRSLVLIEETRPLMYSAQHSARAAPSGAVARDEETAFVKAQRELIEESLRRRIQELEDELARKDQVQPPQPAPALVDDADEDHSVEEALAKNAKKDKKERKEKHKKDKEERREKKERKEREEQQMTELKKQLEELQQRQDAEVTQSKAAQAKIAELHEKNAALQMQLLAKVARAKSASMEDGQKAEQFAEEQKRLLEEGREKSRLREAIEQQSRKAQEDIVHRRILEKRRLRNRRASMATLPSDASAAIEGLVDTIIHNSDSTDRPQSSESERPCSPFGKQLSAENSGGFGQLQSVLEDPIQVRKLVSDLQAAIGAYQAANDELAERYSSVVEQLAKERHVRKKQGWTISDAELDEAEINDLIEDLPGAHSPTGLTQIAVNLQSSHSQALLSPPDQGRAGRRSSISFVAPPNQAPSMDQNPPNTDNVNDPDGFSGFSAFAEEA